MHKIWAVTADDFMLQFVCLFVTPAEYAIFAGLIIIMYILKCAQQ